MRQIIRKLGGLVLGTALLLGALSSTAGARTHWRVYYYGYRRPVYYTYYYPHRYVYYPHRYVYYSRGYYWGWHHWRQHRDWD